MNTAVCVHPLLETYHEGAVCPPYAWLYSSVFSLLQKPVNVRVEPQTVGSSKFQTDGPEVAKLPDSDEQLRGVVHPLWADKNFLHCGSKKRANFGGL